MYNRFIKKDGEVLLDLTDDSVSSSDLLEGVTAHDRSGEKVTGTFTLDNELTAQDNLIAQIQTALENKTIPSGGIDTSDATASANEILQGETAYVNGEKIIGTIETFDGSYECSGESTGGGGIQPKTCTIEFINNYFGAAALCIDALVYTTINNGDLQVVYDNNVSLDTELTINNVLCGSLVFYGFSENSVALHHINSVSENILLLEDGGGLWFLSTTFKAPAEDGDIGTVTFSNTSAGDDSE